VRSGAAASISYPVKFLPWAKEAFGRLGFRFSTELVSFDDIDDGVWEYKGKEEKEVSLKEEKRRFNDAVEPVLRVFWSRDTTDEFFIPKTGSRSSLFFDLAAAGDNKFWKAGFNHRSYFTVWEKFGHILSVRLRGETIDGIGDDLPIYDRLFLGGPKSIRGIEYRNVSPMAKKRESGSWTPWGGQTLVCGTAEYTIPVVNMLRVAAFTDAGSVSADEFDVSNDFAWTVGFGVRIDIPMFPVRFDLATPVEKPEHASKEAFSFSVGYDF
jgi:outer membrane protein insertion porin family